MDLLTLPQILDGESNARAKWQIFMEQGSTKALLLPPNLVEGGRFNRGGLVACLEWLEEEAGITVVFVAVSDKDKALEKSLHFLGFTDAPVEDPVVKVLTPHGLKHLVTKISYIEE